MKSSRAIGPEALLALNGFAEQARSVKRRIVVFLGPRKQRIDRVEGLPLLDVLGELPT